MKINPREFLRSVWRSLTDVPGWPDAPFALRFRRSLPILFPLLATAVLLGWHHGYVAPRLQAAYRNDQPMLALEREIASLHLAFSEQQVADITMREDALRRQLPQDAAKIREVLELLEREGRRQAWDVTFNAPLVPENPARPDLVVADVPVRLRLKPAAGNVEPFSSLLALLDHVPGLTHRIGLMRLSISADEGKWQTVEVGLRFTVPFSNAQAAQ